ncbi:hypothetical protein B0H66DRAFT_17417 [Apodospora peruviana]|uniref:Rhodopsin domain-containing protein n=1 Tax=Apodospora peruviana TaxID=516989 RepID=A0AAE0IQM2_9PEZI|nr:hypothetical protein B0H66DRAFT_17417 [Apodospora peruviana]
MENFTHYPPEVQQKILNGPALTPPPGVIPNFIDPANRNGQAIAVIAVCLFFAACVIVLRLYSRLVVTKRMLPEDFFITYGAIAWCYIDYLQHPGFFVHQWNVRVRDTFHIAKVLLVYPITYSVMMALLKTAILLEWKRLFVPYPVRDRFYWAATIMMCINIVLYIAVIITLCLACVPQEKLWYHWVEGKCIDRGALDKTTASFNLTIDLLIFILPQRIIWVLKMTNARRFGVSIVFGVGLLACICAAGRLYASATTEYEGDAIYTVSSSFYWGFTEVTCGVMVYCFPAIPKAFADNSVLSKVASSLQSLKRLTKFPGSGGGDSATGMKGPDGNSIPPTIGSLPGHARIYRMAADEDGHAISMAEFALIRDQMPPDSGIMKTMELEQREDSMSSVKASRSFERR